MNNLDYVKGYKIKPTNKDIPYGIKNKIKEYKSYHDFMWCSCWLVLHESWIQLGLH